MLKHRNIDLVCVVALVAAVVLAVAFMLGPTWGVTRASANPVYRDKLFDASRVHTVDLVVEDWDGFIEDAPRERYVP